ncbi:peptidoglycan-binding protein [Paracoccus sp. TK19116]|uniref:Peptidoglycan-binding protein n=1 Tax=Paracoccus albicereus TaxID=2922394 RepID=A0ABT1MQR7_9RHOB|nr:peptidoglycan-binding domain-containing protein [Paracoccus albicereus]MCQ0969678.1 peptidoglycan-binding protein [Paracoccus albicereus]
MRIAAIVLAAMLPLQALAQDAVIRIEAKRSAAEAEAAAARWRQSFDDVVTFALPGGWTGIALGPMAEDQAAARLARLIAEGAVPADSFVARPSGDLPLRTVAAPDAPSAGGVPAPAMDLMGTQPTGLAAPDRHLRLQALEDRTEAEAALATWRETFPGAALWQLPNGWFAVGVGPLSEAAANAWLSAFKAADVAPKDSFVATTAEMGAPVVAGDAPDLPEPPESAADLPPLDELQRALRWAGRYDGAIDGQSGPKTRAAIAAEVASGRASPDPGTAMRALIQRRADWRTEMGLTTLSDPQTGLQVIAPMDRLQFDRTERSLSIYAPKDGSGAALILFSQPGGQQELLDLAGLVTALGWVPQPERTIERGRVLLKGANADHLGQAEGWVRDGRAEGYVLIWPAADPENQARIAAELSDSLTRVADASNDPGATMQPTNGDGVAPMIPAGEGEQSGD